MNEIQTGRLQMKALTERDVSSLFRIMSDSDNMRYWTFGPARSIAQTRDRIANIQHSWEAHGFGDWAVWIREPHEMIGLCGLHYVQGMSEVNLGFVLDKSHWSKGYGTEASVASLRFGFECAAIDLVVGVTDPKNLASIGVLENCGMSYWRTTVRNGKLRNVYAIDRARWEGLNLHE